jgi:hypothetical protein
MEAMSGATEPIGIRMGNGLGNAITSERAAVEEASLR